MIEINWQPNRKELRLFAVLLMVFSAVMAAIVWRRTGSPVTPIGIVVAGCAIGCVGLLVPRFLRLVYVTWMVAVFPVGWLVSHVVIGFVYYVVVSPVGILMKLVGRDALHRKFDKSASTYWERREETNDMQRYFRQF